MKHFSAAIVLCIGSLVLTGCNETASPTSAQAPATDAADHQQAMKPAIEESANSSNTDSATHESPLTAEDKPEEVKP
ncbi:hypothetical protein K227x_03140 [Rubripirellula lacrimiformis]|uniref:Lipoprotein n=1 Tax=Rubripirellula lacrimiformis TaxID=1930273 RepID=A0A517N488_9BACT|nr:hypothetical protein [Rubripirellula lacrimiformis]QDT01944.1 hypothetical protein K227x_03140 [Rubripirellula lacrimiformis]